MTMEANLWSGASVRRAKLDCISLQRYRFDRPDDSPPPDMHVQLRQNPLLQRFLRRPPFRPSAVRGPVARGQLKRHLLLHGSRQQSWRPVPFGHQKVLDNGRERFNIYRPAPPRVGIARDRRGPAVSPQAAVVPHRPFAEGPGGYFRRGPSAFSRVRLPGSAKNR